MANPGWLFTAPNTPMELTDVGDPVPNDHQVVIEVAYTGLCHSDIAIIEGPGTHWIAGLPLVLGHEVAGTIHQLGPGVTGWNIGDRVAIALLDTPATPGWASPGLSRNGGYEKFAIAEVRELVKVPDNVDLADAAPATDSATTALHAIITTGKVHEGSVVGIIGLGGLGLNGLQIALGVGATVHGVDTNPKARDEAVSLGISSVHTDTSELAQFAPDVIFDFAGFGDTTAAAVKAVAQHGTVVQVGLGKLEATIDMGRLVIDSISLVGSVGGTKEDLEQTLQMISDGTLKVITEKIPFDTLPDGIRRLTEGGLVGRLVLDVRS